MLSTQPWKLAAIGAMTVVGGVALLSADWSHATARRVPRDLLGCTRDGALGGRTGVGRTLGRDGRTPRRGRARSRAGAGRLA